MRYVNDQAGDSLAELFEADAVSSRRPDGLRRP